MAQSILFPTATAALMVVAPLYACTHTDRKTILLWSCVVMGGAQPALKGAVEAYLDAENAAYTKAVLKTAIACGVSHRFAQNVGTITLADILVIPGAVIAAGTFTALVPLGFAAFWSYATDSRQNVQNPGVAPAAPRPRRYG
ncbi:MAG: hypothetical protein COB66_08880 [Coxiella sp. (in: Bacteria)]|nr:MAG: hypothetical protein COB66_08880 [Coxiella sp. (in: g-proteobacteria)]